LIFYGPDTNKKSTEEEYYNEYNLLTLVDPENETLKPYAQFPEGSMFKSGKAYHFVRTLFEPSGSQTKAIIVNDTTLYTFDNAGNEINRTSIPFDDFVVLKGLSMGQQGMEELTKRSEVSCSASGLLQSEGFDIITYRSGIPHERAIDLFGANRERYDREVADNVNPYKVIILKDGILVSEVMPLPRELVELSVSDPFGNIWATQNVNILDKEPEVVTIYKLRVKEN